MQPFHEIKRRAYDGFIVAIKQNAGRERVSIVKLGEDPKLTTHVMSGFHLGAKRGTAQNHFARTELDGVSQVRMAAGELLERYAFALLREVASEERLELAQIQFFARPHARRGVEKCGHLGSGSRLDKL